MRVKITAYVEVSDPTHATGLTNDDYEALTDALAKLGLEAEFEKVED